VQLTDVVRKAVRGSHRGSHRGENDLGCAGPTAQQIRAFQGGQGQDRTADLPLFRPWTGCPMLSNPAYLLGIGPEYGTHGRIWNHPVATTVATTPRSSLGCVIISGVLAEALGIADYVARPAR
jgi:hypothetical protein